MSRQILDLNRQKEKRISFEEKRVEEKIFKERRNQLMDKRKSGDCTRKLHKE